MRRAGPAGVRTSSFQQCRGSGGARRVLEGWGSRVLFFSAPKPRFTSLLPVCYQFAERCLWGAVARNPVFLQTFRWQIRIGRKKLHRNSGTALFSKIVQSVSTSGILGLGDCLPLVPPGWKFPSDSDELELLLFSTENYHTQCKTPSNFRVRR